MVDAYNERANRENKNKAIVEMRSAQLLSAYMVGKGENLEVFDVFPFWSEDEKKALLIEKWKKVMYSQTTKKGGKE